MRKATQRVLVNREAHLGLRAFFIKIIRVLQATLQRTRAAHDAAYSAALRAKVDIIIASEPNKKLISGNCRWSTDKDKDVGVLCVNASIQVERVLSGRGFITLQLRGKKNLIGCYVSSNIPMEEYKERVDVIFREARRCGDRCVFMGDINAKSADWGSRRKDARGTYLAEWVATQNMKVHSIGGTPTCETPKGTSYIDVTFSTPGMADDIKNWAITEEVTFSYHKHIYFEISGPSAIGAERRMERQILDLDNRRVEEYLREHLGARSRELPPMSAMDLTDIIGRAQRN